MSMFLHHRRIKFMPIDETLYRKVFSDNDVEIYRYIGQGSAAPEALTMQQMYVIVNEKCIGGVINFLYEIESYPAPIIYLGITLTEESYMRNKEEVKKLEAIGWQVDKMSSCALAKMLFDNKKK